MSECENCARIGPVVSELLEYCGWQEFDDTYYARKGWKCYFCDAFSADITECNEGAAGPHKPDCLLVKAQTALASPSPATGEPTP